MSKSEKGEKDLIQDYQDDINIIKKWIERNQKDIQKCKETIEEKLTENKSFVERLQVITDRMNRVKEELEERL